MGLDQQSNPSILGVDLTPGDVKVTHIELPLRQGTPEEFVKINMEKWKESMKKKINESKDFNIESTRSPEDPSIFKRERDTILSLVRSNELASIVKSFEQIEKKIQRQNFAICTCLLVSSLSPTS